MSELARSQQLRRELLADLWIVVDIPLFVYLGP